MTRVVSDKMSAVSVCILASLYASCFCILSVAFQYCWICRCIISVSFSFVCVPVLWFWGGLCCCSICAVAIHLSHFLDIISVNSSFVYFLFGILCCNIRFFDVLYFIYSLHCPNINFSLNLFFSFRSKGGASVLPSIIVWIHLETQLSQRFLLNHSQLSAISRSPIKLLSPNQLPDL